MLVVSLIFYHTTVCFAVLRNALGENVMVGNVMAGRNLLWGFMTLEMQIDSFFLTGIWSRDIKRQTNLAQTAVGKVLKTLETRELVKSVKSVNDGKRKIFVLFDVEPANELTGGLWWEFSTFANKCSVSVHYRKQIIKSRLDAKTIRVGQCALKGDSKEKLCWILAKKTIRQIGELELLTWVSMF